MQTVQDHGAVLREKCRNGTLYRNDAKLASWLGIELAEVNRVIDQLLSAGVLSFDGISHEGSERYKLAAVNPATAETAGLPGKDLSRAEVDPWALATGASESVPAAAINVDRVGLVIHNRNCLEAGPWPATPTDCPACAARGTR